MLFSIIVPVYNVEQYLRQCIESIIPQIIDFSDGAELLLIDDGSEDRSSEICDQYHEMYPDIIKVYHKENEGLLLTRRFGFKKAKGKYILNCDSDDFCEKTQIAELKKIVQDTQADVIFFNSFTLEKNGQKNIFFDNIFGSKKISIIEKNIVLEEYLKSYKIVSMCCKIFKRECLILDYDYSQYKNLDYGEDTMQSAEIYTSAHTFVYYNKPLYYYRVDSGMTKKYTETFYHQSKDVFYYIKNYIEKWNLENTDKLMALKVFSIVGRAITQSRLKTSMTFKERKKYLKMLKEDSMVQEYKNFYPKIQVELKNTYKIMCSLLLAGQYRMIDILLRLKNKMIIC